MRRTCILAAAILALSAQPAAAQSRESLWRQVDEAISKGLPQTAQGLLDQIIPGALADEAHAEATKAICLKIALEGRIQGNKAEEMIVLLPDEIARAPEAMRPVMEAVLAHWYWRYFQANRWRFIQRTQTAEPPGQDFTTWDLARILAEIDQHFTLALAAEATLKAIPIADWDDLLEKGTMPDSYRPTLYDFLAHEALSFYSAGEQGALLPQDTFEIMADGPIFAPVADFRAWGPQAPPEVSSVILKAIRLYQDLLEFHQDDADQTAFADADLHRLVFGYNHALGPEKEARYEAALERFVNDWAGHEIAALGWYEWARLKDTQGDYLQAHTLAQQGWNTYPASVGGILCYNLIQQTKSRSVTIETERVWNDPLPEISVTYRNITRVYFRAVPLDPDETVRFSWWSYVDRSELAAVLAKIPARQWSAELLATTDYQSRTEALPAPEGLPGGPYLLIASHDPSFQEKENRISTTVFWVSDLALVVRSGSRDGTLEGLVLDARTGGPLPGATVTRWTYDGTYYTANGRYERTDQTQSDENGLFRFPHVGEKSWLYHRLMAEHGDQTLATDPSHTTHPPYGDPAPGEQTIFFTDRSLYRPGQTIYYKGICLHTNTVIDDYRTLAGRQLTVVFRDTNYQEIARQQHVCNDYGAFSGSFTAPRDRLLGRMSLQVENGPSGSTSVSIEEYKRPKFKVELAAPAEAPRLATEVVMSGTATAYTGAAIGGAQVSWRVVRRVRFPYWCWWASWRYPALQAQAIASGTTITEADGTFSIAFVAKGDLSILEEDEPIFNFEAHADVTDATGETRSADRIVRAGYTALAVSLDADAWQTPDLPVELTITTESIDGDPEPATGVVRVYRLRQPDKVVRKSLSSSWRGFTARGELQPDPSNPDTWETDDLVATEPFTTDVQGRVVLPVVLDAGIYRAALQSQDRFGKPVAARLTIQVVDPRADHFSVRVPNHFAAPRWSLEPGETLEVLWGTGYDTGRAYVELEARGDVLRAWWTDPARTQELIAEPITEGMRGGLTVRVTYVRENRLYLNERIVEVPWTNKDLTVTWEHFTSLLEPGQKETWTAVVKGPGAHQAIAEMVAGMYDASLDQYLPHDWIRKFSGFYRESPRLSSHFENRLLSLSTVVSDWVIRQMAVTVSYRHFPTDIVALPIPGPAYGRGGGAPYAETDGYGIADDKDAGESGPDLSQVEPRTHLDETAFFFPHLRSDAEGVVRIEFTMPEALTEWRFMGFAHDNLLRSGFLAGTTVTAKDLMVEPNPPRFVREGDTIEFTVKVTNVSPARQTGKVRLTLSDARTLEPRDDALNNIVPEQDFDVPSMESRAYSWRLTVPDGCELLIYQAVGATTRLSDGEEGYLPVLSRRVLVTESLPLPIRGPQTKQFEFTKLLASGQSSTLRHQSLVVQMVSQPAWYAVMALPYLMEYPYECSEQIFNRFYANALAAYIVNSDPKIERIFDQWRATPALDSPLEKNEDLKGIALEETPWVRDAVSEARARRNVGILFDQNRLNDEMSRALFQLGQMQYSDGLWPWLPGLRGSEYITLYIVTGFGRLRHLGLDQADMTYALKALNALDRWMDTRYRDILLHGDKDANHLSPTVALYLYGRSFFLAEKPIAAEYHEARDYWLSQARTFWLSLWRQNQAHLALGLKRFGDGQTPVAIMQSIREHSVTDEELGRYWRDTERSWWWHRAPIETQALMIEAFDEVAGDARAVEECRVWLLKQKQTQRWSTTKATADAVYGLLLRGTDLLSSEALVEVALGGEWIEPHDVEAGTGFYEERFVRDEITPAMGQITVKKIDDGVSWGSVHWQYLEDVSKVTPYEGTPLQLEKAVFVKKTNAQGLQALDPVAGPLAVGDELVVRIVLRVDRDMEFVHLKDQRGSGTEPVNVLSRYRYRDGLAYYESTRDAATHFFVDHLPKGTYVFEYSTRIQHRGRYQTGTASIQCMYAPEFNSHSASFELEVQ